MTICDNCKEQVTIETLLSKEGEEIEMEYCKKCKILFHVTMAGYENE